LKTEYIVLKGGTLIDGTGNKPLENSIVVIHNSKITMVGDEADIDIPPDANIISSEGHTILPGLIDAHVHLSGTRSPDLTEWILETDPALRAIRTVADAWALLQAGYTTVRCCGSTISLALKKGIDEGLVQGPRIMAARQMITRTGGHERHSVPIRWMKEVGLTRLADGVEDCQRAVREQLREGADFIKICTGVWGESRRFPKGSADYTLAETQAMVEEAHRTGVKVASHTIGKEGIMIALKAGVDTIEHGVEFDAEACKTMKAQNTFLIPTISAAILKETELDMLDKKWRTLYESGELKTLNEQIFDNVQLAHSMEVKIAAGSDITGAPFFGGNFFGDNACELELLVQAGLSPMEAILSATKNGAEALGLDAQLGTVEPGKSADLLVIKKNPLNDITVLQNKDNVRLVIKNGNIIVHRSVQSG
jgi:imidazolonepropionase-like amidohydrolase